MTHRQAGTTVDKEIVGWMNKQKCNVLATDNHLTARPEDKLKTNRDVLIRSLTVLKSSLSQFTYLLNVSDRLVYNSMTRNVTKAFSQMTGLSQVEGLFVLNVSK